MNELLNLAAKHGLPIYGGEDHPSGLRVTFVPEAELLRLLRELSTLRWDDRKLSGLLNCRCGWDDNDKRTFEDGHCPVHGTYDVSKEFVLSQALAAISTPSSEEEA